MPKGIYIRTEKHKKILREKCSYKKGNIPWNKGKKGIYSKEYLRKIGLASSKRKHSEKTKKQIGLSVKKFRNLYGYNLTARGKEKLRSVWFKKGHPTFWTENSRKIASINRSGNKNPSWLGGKSFEPYSIDWTNLLKEKIRIRDNNKCQLCGNFGKHIHHINYDKKNCNENNLVVLCVSCHMKTNFNRENWINYFNNKLYARL